MATSVAAPKEAPATPKVAPATPQAHPTVANESGASNATTDRTPARAIFQQPATPSTRPGSYYFANKDSYVREDVDIEIGYYIHKEKLGEGKFVCLF
jgi:hypothetical protein